jgi:hypothetical protein
VIRVKRAVPALLTAGLVAALPAAAGAAPTHATANHHRAHAAGGGVPPTLPSIVGVRVTRGEASLARAGDYVDRDMPDKAVASLLNARRNMYAAWRGAKYVIENAPPPVAGDAAVHRGKAHASGTGAGAGTVYADPPTTALAVLGYQHDVAAASYGLLDGAKGALRDSVSTTIFAALDRRDAAIAYIHAIPPPPAADAGFHRGKAHASGAPVGSDFSTLMPGIIPDLDDELQQIKGLISGGALTTGEKRIMNLAQLQVFNTEQTVNTFWPPLPAAG